MWAGRTVGYHGAGRVRTSMILNISRPRYCWPGCSSRRLHPVVEDFLLHFRNFHHASSTSPSSGCGHDFRIRMDSPRMADLDLFYPTVIDESLQVCLHQPVSMVQDSCFTSARLLQSARGKDLGDGMAHGPAPMTATRFTFSASIPFSSGRPFSFPFRPAGADSFSHTYLSDRQKIPLLSANSLALHDFKR